MAGPDFEAMCYPRIGKDAAEELRRFRRTAWLGPPMVACAVGAGLLIGASTVGDCIGAALVLVCVVGLWLSLRQWRTSVAVGRSFGFKGAVPIYRS